MNRIRDAGLIVQLSLVILLLVCRAISAIGDGAVTPQLHPGQILGSETDATG